MQEVGRVVPALPVSLVATALLAGGDRGLSSLELKGAVFELMQPSAAAGAHVHIPRSDQEYAVEVGLRMLMLRHLVELNDGVYRPNPREHALLAYYANAIAHLSRESGRRCAAPDRGSAEALKHRRGQTDWSREGSPAR